MNKPIVRRPDYFFAQGDVYLFVRYEAVGCSLHGEFSHYSVAGRKVKTSGYVGSASYCFHLDTLDANSRDCMERYIESHESLMSLSTRWPYKRTKA